MKKILFIAAIMMAAFSADAQTMSGREIVKKNEGQSRRRDTLFDVGFGA